LSFVPIANFDFKLLAAIAAILIMTLVNVWGINRTAFGAKVLASITISFLTVVILAAAFSDVQGETLSATGPDSVLTASALLFFAFAGYARVATLGGEVSNPERTIPKAIAISLGIVIVIYLSLSVVLPAKLGVSLTSSITPIADLVDRVVPGVDGQSVAIFAAIAALGSLLALLAGMSRTAAIMAQDGELPAALSRLNSRGVPFVAEWLVALLAILLVTTDGVEFVIGLSSFAVLLYYAIANLAAIRQPKIDSSRSKALSVAGLAMCLVVGVFVPPSSLVLGSTMISLIVFLRWGLAKLR
jgi:APA family basic amino acid/polyamine antiporter